jgi:hypothetical protein
MAKLTISDAARVAGVARSTLHRAIKQGRLSVDPDGHLDTAELLRAGYTLQRSLPHETRQALQGATPRSRSAPQVSIPADMQPMMLMHQERDLLRLERDLLRRELDAAHIREQTALERAQATREREALLLRMLEHVQQQRQRLLEAGRRPVPPPAPDATPARAPARTRPQPAAARPAVPPPTVAQPVFDPCKHVLGKLCRRQHAYQDTGQSLLRLPGRSCLLCDRERTRERRQAQREARQ